MNLGSQIKKYRSELSMSQDELAEKIFVSRQSISNWENDKTYPDIKSLLLLSEVFQVSLDQLIKGDLEIMKKEISTQELAEFEKDATLFDVAQTFHKCVGEAKKDGENGESNDGTQALVKIINMCPSFIIKGIIGTLRFLDNRGLMPKAINKLSPFHSSIYITNVGSIGLSSVYHHLYEFGTTSLFFAIGKMYAVKELQADGTFKTRNKIKVRIVVDERICDGFYFSQAIKHFRHLMNNPELLLEKPNYISTDR